MLAAADFFTVEVWGPRGLVTFYVFSVHELVGQDGPTGATYPLPLTRANMLNGEDNGPTGTATMWEQLNGSSQRRIWSTNGLRLDHR